MHETSTSSIAWRSRVRLVDEVADELRSRIYAGRYAPGVPLRQEQLAAELEVSRTPLREAMRMLEREGLITVSPGRGARVVSGDLATLIAAYELREVVDGLAARLAARRTSPKLAKQLRQSIARQRKTLAPWTPSAYTRANVEFHTEIAEAAGNEFVVAQLPLVGMTSRVFIPVQFLDLSRAELAVSEHEQIVEAIAAGEPEEAERLARAHIRRTSAALAEHAASGGEDAGHHGEGSG